MRFKIKNKSTLDQRIMLIPIINSGSSVDLTTSTNPTADVSDEGLFSVCLSPPLLEMDCSLSPVVIQLPMSMGGYYRLKIDGESITTSTVRQLVINGMTSELVFKSEDINNSQTTVIINYSEKPVRVTIECVDANLFTPSLFNETGLSLTRLQNIHNLSILAEGEAVEFCLGTLECSDGFERVLYLDRNSFLDFSDGQMVYLPLGLNPTGPSITQPIPITLASDGFPDGGAFTEALSQQLAPYGLSAKVLGSSIIIGRGAYLGGQFYDKNECPPFYVLIDNMSSFPTAPVGLVNLSCNVPS